MNETPVKCESYKHVAPMFFLLHILNKLQQLSLTFQKDEVLLVMSKIPDNNPSWHLMHCLQDQFYIETFELSLSGNVFETVTLNKMALQRGWRADQYEQQGCSCHKPIFGHQISQFFCNFAAERILEVAHWPHDCEQLSVFGEEEVNVLSDHFYQ